MYFLPAISIFVSRKTPGVASRTSALLLLAAAVVVVVGSAAAAVTAVEAELAVACFLEAEGLLDPLEEAVEELLDNGGGGQDDFSILFSIAEGRKGSLVE